MIIIFFYAICDTNNDDDDYYNNDVVEWLVVFVNQIALNKFYFKIFNERFLI